MKKNILVKNNGLSLIIFTEKTLLPGINTVDSDIFAQMKKKAPHFFDEQEPMIEAVEENTENEGDEPLDIDSYSLRQAKKIISETVEMDLLNRWLSETDKDKNKVVIEKQIELINETQNSES
jgi:hypothetical protein